MAKLKILLLGAFIICLFSESLFAQSGDKMEDESLIGVWVLDTEAQMKSAINGNRKGTIDLNKEILKHQKDQYSSRYYGFAENGSFVAFWSTNGDARNARGKWKLGPDKVLHLDMDDSSSISYTAVQTKNFLILKPFRKGGQPLHLKRAER